MLEKAQCNLPQLCCSTNRDCGGERYNITVSICCDSCQHNLPWMWIGRTGIQTYCLHRSCKANLIWWNGFLRHFWKNLQGPRPLFAPTHKLISLHLTDGITSWIVRHSRRSQHSLAWLAKELERQQPRSICNRVEAHYAWLQTQGTHSCNTSNQVQGQWPKGFFSASGNNHIVVDGVHFYMALTPWMNCKTTDLHRKNPVFT